MLRIDSFVHTLFMDLISERLNGCRDRVFAFTTFSSITSYSPSRIISSIRAGGNIPFRYAISIPVAGIGRGVLIACGVTETIG